MQPVLGGLPPAGACGPGAQPDPTPAAAREPGREHTSASAASAAAAAVFGPFVRDPLGDSASRYTMMDPRNPFSIAYLHSICSAWRH